MNTNELRKAIESEKANSAWSKAVKEYALELLEDFTNNNPNEEFYGSPADKKSLLNGADDWEQYSFGGCSLIYDGDIAERTCSPSEYKKSNEGSRNPNARETWLDVQARALFQASRMICRLARV